ncbi:hypothetical protein MTR_5g019510 [Medicago truncatula]|uniref:Uncharacterized protein n=1 Tax=Medicago truncatula TaxID=3880 RepID=G7KC56_MEDTR|nr:hypothetical protein MTR_5g019510 [Medicago truncatula]
MTYYIFVQEKEYGKKVELRENEKNEESKEKENESENGVLYMQTSEQGTIPLTPVDDYYDRTPRNVIQKAWDLSRFMSVPMKIVVSKK